MYQRLASRRFHSSFARFARPKCVSLIGAPLHFGQSQEGVKKGPFALHNQNLVSKLQMDGHQIDDHGDLHFKSLSEFTYPSRTRAIGKATSMISSAVKASVAEKKFCITLGGDHSVSIGSIAALLTNCPNLVVVWVDAHADLNTPETTTSGNLHGMPLSFLLDLPKSRSLPGFEWIHSVPLLCPSRLIYIGLRDVDPPEQRFIQKYNIRTFTMKDVRKIGLSNIMKILSVYLSSLSPSPHVHLSFDIDAIDPVHAPATGTPVKGGLSEKEAYCVTKTLAETKLLKSMDLVEINPELNTDADQGQTAKLGVQLIQSALL